MQNLILFDNVLDANAISKNEKFQKELGAMANYVFGDSNYSIVEGCKNSEKLHEWCSDELDKSLRRKS